MSSFAPSKFLRLALGADAASSAVMASPCAAGATPLSGLLGLPEPFLRFAGLALLPWAALVALRGDPRDAAAGLCLGDHRAQCHVGDRFHRPAVWRSGPADGARHGLRDRAGHRGSGARRMPAHRNAPGAVASGPRPDAARRDGSRAQGDVARLRAGEAEGQQRALETASGRAPLVKIARRMPVRASASAPPSRLTTRRAIAGAGSIQSTGHGASRSNSSQQQRIMRAGEHDAVRAPPPSAPRSRARSLRRCRVSSIAMPRKKSSASGASLGAPTSVTRAVGGMGRDKVARVVARDGAGRREHGNHFRPRGWPPPA